MGPVRMCKICRTRAPKTDLARFVLDQAKPGRGSYVCSNISCQQKIKVHS